MLLGQIALHFKFLRGTMLLTIMESTVVQLQKKVPVSMWDNT